MIAIELAADNFACLVRNVPEAECIHACLSDSREKVGYEGDGHINSPIRRVIPGDEVESITIDSLDLQGCGFIKLDLQGYDLKALRGARNTLEKFHPTVKFESEKKTIKRYGNIPRDAEDYLHSLGYYCAKKSNEPVYVFDRSI